jgi:hypothetical protein
MKEMKPFTFRKMQSKQHTINSVSFEGDVLHLKVDGGCYSFELSDISPGLLHADEQTRNTYSLAPSGYGIHWESIDEDLSIDGLLGICHQPERKVELTSVSEVPPKYGYNVNKK